MRAILISSCFAMALSGCAGWLTQQNFNCSPGRPQRIDTDQAIRPPTIDAGGYKNCE